MSDDWQPIGTAPKDGTEILLYRKWEEDKWPERISAYWNEDVGAWIVAGGEFEQLYINAVPFTHWMPLPDPPVV